MTRTTFTAQPRLVLEAVNLTNVAVLLMIGMLFFSMGEEKKAVDTATMLRGPCCLKEKRERHFIRPLALPQERHCRPTARAPFLDCIKESDRFLVPAR
jgi:hypothetical protein